MSRCFAFLLAFAFRPAFLDAASPAPSQELGLTVKAFVGQVLLVSPEVKSSVDAFNAADAAYKARLGAMMLPTAQVSATAYPYGHDPNDGYRFERWRMRRDAVRFDTTLNWNVFNSFRDYTQVRSASLARSAAERAMTVSRQDKSFVAIQAFYNYNSRLVLLEVARQNLKAQEDQYRQTHDLYRNGMKSLADLLKSETDLRSSELRLTTAEAEEKRARLGFNALLDRPGLTAAALLVDTSTQALRLPPVEADVARSLSARPEVSQARRELEVAAVAVTQSLQDFLPAISVDAAWSRSDTARFSGTGASSGVPSPRYAVGLSLALPIGFNVITQAYGIVAARAQKRRAEAALAAAVRSAREEVYGAFISLERAMKAHSIAQMKEDIARRSLELVSAQYRQGSADAIRMNQAQTDFLNARVERTLALHDMFIESGRYRRAVGDPLW